MGVFWAAQPVAGWPYHVEATPVPLAQDPRQHVHLEVQLLRELGADQIRRARAFPPRDQLAEVIVAAVLRREGGRVAGERRADAAARRGLVDVQPLLGAAGVSPAKRPAASRVVEADHRVRRLGRVGAGAAGQLRQNLVQIPLQELALAVEPFLTAVHICWERGQRI